MKNLIFILGLFLISTNIFSQEIPNIGLPQGTIENEAKKILTVEISQSHLKIIPGEDLYLILKVKIDSEWHINSNKPKEDYLIPTEVSIDSKDGFLLSQKKFPQAKELKFDFSDVPVSVYEGEFEIPIVVRIPENLSEGDYQFEVIFNYQACNNQTCLPPKEEKIPVRIQLTTNSSEIVKIRISILTYLLIKQFKKNRQLIQSLKEKAYCFLSFLYFWADLLLI